MMSGEVGLPMAVGVVVVVGQTVLVPTLHSSQCGEVLASCAPDTTPVLYHSNLLVKPHLSSKAVP